MDATSKPSIDKVVKDATSGQVDTDVKSLMRNGKYSIYDIVQFIANAINACVTWVNAKGGEMVDAEIARQTAETGRVAAEQVRVAAEQVRVAAEQVRVANDAKRAKIFDLKDYYKKGTKFDAGNVTKCLLLYDNKPCKYQFFVMSKDGGYARYFAFLYSSNQSFCDAMALFMLNGYDEYTNIGSGKVRGNGSPTTSCEDLVAWNKAKEELGIIDIDIMKSNDLLLRTTGLTISMEDTSAGCTFGNVSLKNAERFAIVVNSSDEDSETFKIESTGQGMIGGGYASSRLCSSSNQSGYNYFDMCSDAFKNGTFKITGNMASEASVTLYIV